MVNSITLIPFPEGYKLEIDDDVYTNIKSLSGVLLGYGRGKILKIHGKTATILLEDGTKILNEIHEIYTTVDLLRDLNIKRIDNSL